MGERGKMSSVCLSVRRVQKGKKRQQKDKMRQEVSVAEKSGVYIFSGVGGGCWKR